MIVDVAIDQGGCIASSEETTHTAPVIEKFGVQHYAVGNMPGAVPFTSTEALVSVTLPYIVTIAGRGLSEQSPNVPSCSQGSTPWKVLSAIRGRQGPGCAAPPPHGLPALSNVN